MTNVTLTPVDTLAGCPFSEKEAYYKIYNDGGHYVAKPYFHSYQKRPSDKTPLEKVFELLYDEAYKKHRKKDCTLLDNEPFIKYVQPILEARFPKDNVTKEKIEDLIVCRDRKSYFDETPLKKMFYRLYDEALYKQWKKARKPLNVSEFVEHVTPILKARFPKNGVTEKMIMDMIARKKQSLLSERKNSRISAIDIAFDSVYAHSMRNGFKGDELTENVKAGLSKVFPDHEDLDTYVSDKIEKKQRNLYARKKRFRRKGALNRWNYFVTFTYNDKLHTAETFRKKLRKCLSNLHTRRGWKYMGVFEEAPETGRLHFHGLFYIPDGEMLGTITEEKDYSEKQGKIQITHSNDFFKKNFGKNDFEELNAMELKRGQTLNYILKYLGKTGERIVYSRGIPTEICKKLTEREIATEMTDYVKKFVLFDDTIEWERDVMHYTKIKQITIIDVLCNPPRTA